MVATAIAGFAHVTSQQQIADRRCASRASEIQAVHQALTQADADVLYFVRGDRGAARQLLCQHRRPRDRRTKRRSASSIRCRRPTACSRRRWRIDRRAARRLGPRRSQLGDRGDAAAARGAACRQPDRRRGRGSVGRRSTQLLARADAQFPLHESRIQLGTLLVLLLQVLQRHAGDLRRCSMPSARARAEADGRSRGARIGRRVARAGGAAVRDGRRAAERRPTMPTPMRC